MKDKIKQVQFFTLNQLENNIMYFEKHRVIYVILKATLVVM